MNFTRKTYFIGIIVIVALSALWKLGFLFFDKFPFNSDEAIVGLMARHILAGERPTFFYGQSYMGSLDSFLVSLGFLIGGVKVESIRFVQIALYALVVLSTAVISKTVFESKTAGMITGILLAVPTVNMTLYTTVSLGGYNEALLTGNIVILTVLKLDRILRSQNGKLNITHYFLFSFLGFMTGVGVWANGLTLVYVFGAGLFMIWAIVSYAQEKIKLMGLASLFLGAGILIGAGPYWAYGLDQGWDTLIGELLGSAVSVETGSFLQIAVGHIRNFLLLGLPALIGARPPWTVRWLALPLIPVILFCWVYVILRYVTDDTHKQNLQKYNIIFYGVAIILVAAFIFTSFGVDPSGRYFLPLSIILSILAGFTISKLSRKWQLSFIGVFLLFHIIGTVQSARSDPPAITTQFDAATIIDHSYDDELVNFLLTQEEYYGYTNYWVAYPIAFKSGEELIYIPSLPYHIDMRYTERDNRYQPYQNQVEAANKVAYISSNHPPLERYLREQFQRNAIVWEEKAIGDYLVFYQLSEVIRPEDIGLGFTQ